jgi:hypothetical protein
LSNNLYIVKSIIILIILAFVNIPNLYSQIIWGYIPLDFSYCQKVNSNHKTLELSTKYRLLLNGTEDISYVDFLTMGICQKSASEWNRYFCKFVLVDSYFRDSDRNPSVFKATVISYDRTGLYDFDVKWFDLGFGFGTSSDNLGKDEYVDFVTCINAGLRSLKFGDYNFKTLEEFARSNLFSVNSGFTANLSAKFGNFHADAGVATQILMNSPSLYIIDSGLKLTYVIKDSKSKYKNSWKIGLQYDFNKTLIKNLHSENSCCALHVSYIPD